MNHTGGAEQSSAGTHKPMPVVPAEPPTSTKASSQMRSPRERNQQFVPASHDPSLSAQVLGMTSTTSRSTCDPTSHKPISNSPATTEMHKGVIRRGQLGNETVLTSFGLSDFNATLGRNSFQEKKQGSRSAVSKLEARIQIQLEDVNKKIPDSSSKLKMSKTRAQIKILDDAKDDLLRQIEVHSKEKAELSRKIWASSADLHSRIYSELSVVSIQRHNSVF